ncbi:phasin family protein [Cupriavidus sp. 2TAF22]|uniref:phasin family protein n=1 Tax=unclassified Cupriavidus TaxID=2640874 RepID=UPI003F92BCE9
MAQPPRSTSVEAHLAFPDPFFGLADTWTQAAEKIGALNAQTAQALFAEGAEYAAEAAAQPFTFGTFRPEMADVMGQRMAAYLNSLNEIINAAQLQWTQGLHQQFAAISGSDPFQWCLMGRDFLPDQGNVLPAMGDAMTKWVTAYLPGAAPLLPAPGSNGSGATQASA